MPSKDLRLCDKFILCALEFTALDVYYEQIL